MQINSFLTMFILYFAPFWLLTFTQIISVGGWRESITETAQQHTKTAIIANGFIVLFVLLFSFCFGIQR